MALASPHFDRRQSGCPYTTPVVYTTDGDRLVVIASKGGAPSNPDWYYYNLVAHPTATVELPKERFQAKVIIATGAERERLFNHQAKEMPQFAEYQKKTTRRIPVIVLERIQAGRTRAGGRAIP